MYSKYMQKDTCTFFWGDFGSAISGTSLVSAIFHTITEFSSMLNRNKIKYADVEPKLR